MHTRLITAVSLLGLVGWVQAEEPKDNLSGAVKKLAEAANYSWTSTSESTGGRGGPSAISGKTEKDGFTLISSENQDGDKTEAVLKGGKGVVKVEGEWKTEADLRAAAGGGGGGGGGRGGFGARRLLTARTPAAELANLVAKAKEIKADGDALVGELTEEGAKELSTFGRGGRRPGADAGGTPPPAPKNAKASFKAWVKEGALTKYEVQSSATVTMREEERDISRKTTVEIKDLGSTKVEVTEDAKKAVEAAPAKTE